MSAMSNECSTTPTDPLERRDGQAGNPDASWELHRQQIASQLLRDFEVQRLPEALDIRDQVLNGELVTAADRDSLAQMVRLVDRASVLLEDKQDLEDARRSVAKLREEILGRAHVNERGAAAVDAMLRAHSHQAPTAGCV
ncbi:MAG: hypothetical protein WBG92_04365 [Thiohalocapsa sp.]